MVPRTINEIWEEGTEGWKEKFKEYERLGVDVLFSRLETAYRARLEDGRGICYKDLAHQCAQVEVDRYITQRLNGVDCSEPHLPIPGELEMTEGTQEESYDYARGLWWIYRHLKVKDVKPQDCPDSGTWGYFQLLRENPDAQAKFYEQVFPKVALKAVDDSSLVEDDKRTQFEVLDKLYEEFIDGDPNDNQPIAPKRD